MPRPYSFDHFTAQKPDQSKTLEHGAHPNPPVEETKPTVPPSEEGQLHYGRQHAQTAELYQKHRAEREARGDEVQLEPMGGEAPPREEPVIHGKEEPGTAERAPLESGRERLKGLAQQAVSSVLQAAREASKGRPLSATRKLAGEAVSGARKVAREVSARSAKEPSEKKGPGKKR